MSQTALVAADLIAISILVFAMYFPRYRRRDMVVAILGLNVGVMAVATALSTAQVGALTASQVAALTSRQVAVLSTEAIAAFSTEQVAALSARAIPGLTTAQIGALGIEQADALTATQIAALNARPLPGAPGPVRCDGWFAGTGAGTDRKCPLVAHHRPDAGSGLWPGG